MIHRGFVIPNPQHAAPDPVAVSPADGGLLDQPEIIDLTWEMLTKSPITIGRGSDTDIRLDHKTVSRRHSELRRDPFGRWTVCDLGSRNGTSVNERAGASEPRIARRR